jgi:hypothetical protein
MTAFFLLQLPRESLQRRKGALEERIVDHVGFAVLALHNPVAFRHVAEANVGGNRFGLFALRGINDQRSKCTECTHGSSIGALPISSLKDFIRKECDVDLLGIYKG